MSRYRSLLQTGGSALIVLAMMLLGGLALWVGVPLLWLYLGSQIQTATGSLGLAMLAVIVGVLASIVAVVMGLAWLNEHYARLRAARGLDDHGNVALEAILAISAGIAVAVFGAWFFLFSGASPIPINPPEL